VLKVLIVEDSFGTRLVYRLWFNSLFEQIGRQGVVHEVDSLNGATERLDAAKTAPYHLALLDIAFPVERKDAQGRNRVELNSSAGLGLCQLMGREHPNTPIIVASATRMDRSAVDFLNDKTQCPTVRAFVIEPFSHERFLDIAEPVLREAG
jgi:CheY-like chemotaxis protein